MYAAYMSPAHDPTLPSGEILRRDVLSCSATDGEVDWCLENMSPLKSDKILDYIWASDNLGAYISRPTESRWLTHGCSLFFTNEVVEDYIQTAVNTGTEFGEFMICSCIAT